ncbi:MAG TPA: sensor histidine kinase [Gemmatimonadaceae bacterium]|nr:sensor histidine kinase [Gemmatimonadaceae bacterium]
MRLAQFIEENREPILADWEAFALTCSPASGAMDIEALRDHANEMLTVIADDLKTAQGSHEQAEKSKGKAPAAPADADANTAAEHHGAGRAQSGFTVAQMVAEFRALRASVIRLWTKSQGELAPAEIEDLTRFNEAIDQSLAESVSRYTEDLDRSKEMFLAILGHDLRSPLGAVMMSAEFMLETAELSEPHLTLTKRISSSAGRMNHMIGDLLDFTRSRLGGGIPIVRAEMSMEKAVHDVIDEIVAANPSRVIKIDARGGARGEWDCARISQALTNLIGNAIDHGSATSVITVSVDGEGDQVTISIHNSGPPIAPAQLNGIFSAMKSAETMIASTAANPSKHLGLGLYIAERIVTAHKGTISVHSTEAQGTTFTIQLPR